MILPNVRTSFGREEAGWLVRSLADETGEDREHWESLLSDRGIDVLLDDPRTLSVVLGGERAVSLVPAPLALYVILRHALLDSGIDSRVLTDYVTALVVEFGRHGRARKIAPDDEKEYRYLVDIVSDMASAEGRRAFLLRAHLGNFALWLSGLYPDHIVYRVRRRGGPGLDYYEEMGTTGYRLAADDPHARSQAIDSVLRGVAGTFGELRRALNRFSDEYLLPRPASPVDRLLRQATSDFIDDRD